MSLFRPRVSARCPQSIIVVLLSEVAIPRVAIEAIGLPSSVAMSVIHMWVRDIHLPPAPGMGGPMAPVRIPRRARWVDALKTPVAGTFGLPAREAGECLPVPAGGVVPRRGAVVVRAGRMCP